MKSQTPSPRVGLWRRIAVGIVLVLALSAALFQGEEKPKHGGKPLSEWLRGQVVFAIEPDQATNLAMAFHAAGFEGTQLLLGELDAPSDRMAWAIHRLTAFVEDKAGRFSPIRRSIRPVLRAAGAERLIRIMAPPDGDSLGLLTNKFLLLSRSPEDTATTPTRASFLRHASLPDSSELRGHRHQRFGDLTRWISKDGNLGLKFLINQIGATTSSVVRGATLAALGSRNPPPGEAVVAAIVAARYPDNEFQAAILLTRLQAEPSIALPILMRHAATNPALNLSFVTLWGTNAAPWLPQILPLATNADPQVSFLAEIAVRKIRGEPK